VNLQKRINAFATLGDFLSQFLESHVTENIQLTELNKLYFNEFDKTLHRAKIQNAWFTNENIRFAIKGIAKMLKKEVLEKWVSSYSIENQNKTSKKIGVVMAGNIPLVGFHDLLCVLISGNNLFAKLSSKDQVLIQFIANLLIAIEPDFKNRIQLTTETLKGIDAIIATGSNNSSRYFEYYFAKYPHIIRKNRSSVAVLNGKESQQDLENLGHDIFMYFGLGCRNVSKIFIHQDFDIQLIFKNIVGYNQLIQHHKYANNYDYNRAIYLINTISFLENGFSLFKEDFEYSSPIAVVFYERFSDLEKLKKRLLFDSDKIQCIVSNEEIEGSFAFGEAQFPAIDDYADGIDTMQFLTKKIK